MATPWLDEAHKFVGLKEIIGSQHEPEIVRFFAESGNDWVKDDETAWCGAFVAAMFARAGLLVRPPGDRANALRARAWLDVGTPVTSPTPGDLAIFWRGSKTAATGHVGFYVGQTEKEINVLGGNQSNSVSIAKHAKSRLLGYRRVTESAAPTAPLPPPPDVEPTLPPPVVKRSWLAAFFARLFGRG